MNRLGTATIAALMAMAGLSSAARAEVLTIEGMTPANSPDFAQIISIAIERFGGSDGRTLAFELEDRLVDINISGRSYFDVIGGRSAVQPDATLSGNVTAGVEEFDTVGKRRRCVERDDKDKCVTYKDIKVKCVNRIIDFRAQLRATRFSDGRSIYAESFPDRQEQTVCIGDEQDFASSESVIRAMISSTATAIRNDLAPRSFRQDVRVLESRKGMTRAESDFFKSAVRMTKTNAAEACRMWDEAAENGQVHISLTFNRGLCAEQRGDLDAALALYDEADRLAPGKIEVTEARQRASDHLRALDEWELRQSGGSDG